MASIEAIIYFIRVKEYDERRHREKSLMTIFTVNNGLSKFEVYEIKLIQFLPKSLLNKL